MSVRPHLWHVIGFQKDRVPNFAAWKKKFEEEERYEEDFLEATGSAWEKVGDDEWTLSYKETFKDKALSGYLLNESRLDVFGILPIFHANDSHIGNMHDLPYTLVEAGIFSEKGDTIIRVPYQDYSDVVSGTKTKEEVSDLAARMELRHYEGKWGRRYANHPMNWYDDDFDFALEFFKKEGFELEAKDLDRYLVFYWC